MTRPPPRDLILALLRERGELSVAELTAALGPGYTDRIVRWHVQRLERDGAITHRTRAWVYRLKDAA